MTVDRQPTPRPMATAAVRPGRTRRILITPFRVVVAVAVSIVTYGAMSAVMARRTSPAY